MAGSGGGVLDREVHAGRAPSGLDQRTQPGPGRPVLLAVVAEQLVPEGAVVPGLERRREGEVGMDEVVVSQIRGELVDPGVVRRPGSSA